MNKLWGVYAAALVAVAWAEAAQAQSAQPLQPPSSVQNQIREQESGVYPTLQNRSVLPLGAINKKWADQCGQTGTTIAVQHSPHREIQFRVRQLLGTVVTFPEPVQIVSQPGGGGFTAEAYGPKGTVASRVWVFGAANAGISANYVFGGGSIHGFPTLYTLQVQAEGINTENCPDLMVLVHAPVSEDMKALAQMMHDFVARTGEPITGNGARQSGEVLWPSTDLGPVRDNLTGDSGRAGVDYLEGKDYDPSNLVFDWSMRGDETLAPDIVYSDGYFTYLKYHAERVDRVRIAAIHAVERTGGGKIDTPVNWNWKGNTIVVQGVQPLTLEREGIVLCIDPATHLVAPERMIPTDQHLGDVERADASDDGGADGGTTTWIKQDFPDGGGR